MIGLRSGRGNLSAPERPGGPGAAGAPCAGATGNEGRRMVLRTGLVIGLGVALAGSAWADSRTLQQALAAAYSGNPALQAARAQLRSVDENVPQALAGWRPEVTIAASVGTAQGDIRVPQTDVFGVSRTGTIN